MRPSAPAACLMAAATILLLLLGTTLGRPFWHVDEYTTALRAREMADTGNWLTVQQNFQHTFNKPPLYYALTAPLARIDRDGYWPARVVSALYGAGCLVLVASITRRMAPASRWAPPLAVAATLASPPFLLSLASAHLETGLAFYLLAAFRALLAPPGPARNAVFLASVALCGLHKFPAPLFLLLAAALAGALHPACAGSRRAWVRPALWALAGLLPLAAWIAWNMHLHGRVVWDHFVVREMLHRAAAADTFYQAGDVWKYLEQLLFSPVALTGGLAAAAAILIGARHSTPAHLLLAAGFAAGFLALCLMSFKSVRYLVPLLPLGALLAATAATRWEGRPRWLPAATVLCLTAALAQAIATPLLPRWTRFEETVAMVREFRTLPGHPLMLEGSRLSTKTVAYEADFGKAIDMATDLDRLPAGTPVRILADRKRFEEFQNRFEAVAVIRENRHVLLFTARRSAYTGEESAFDSGASSDKMP